MIATDPLLCALVDSSQESAGDVVKTRAADPGTPIQARFRMWIVWGRITIGRGRADLLDAIARMGSISAAARTVGISYRAAWNWVEGLNADPDGPLVEATPGGRGGGGAQLTARGKQALAAWQKAQALFEARAAEVNGELDGS